MKEYKVVNGPKAIRINANENLSEAAQKYSEFINSHAAQGWQYKSSSTLTVNKKGGCLRKDSADEYKMMIFEREQGEGETSASVSEPIQNDLFESDSPCFAEQGKERKSFNKLFLIIGIVVAVVICGFFAVRILFHMPIFNRPKVAVENNSVLLECDYLQFYVPDYWQDNNVRYSYIDDGYSMDISAYVYDPQDTSKKCEIELKLFQIGFLPLEQEYVGDGSIIGTIEFDSSDISNDGKSAINPGKYQLYVVNYLDSEKFDYAVSVFADIIERFRNDIPEVIKTVSTKYGKVHFQDGKIKEKSQVASEYLGKNVSLNYYGVNIYEKPDENSAVITTGYEKERGSCTEENGDFIKIKIARYDEHKIYDGWCKKSDVTTEKIITSFSADVPLDFESAKAMLDMYTDTPFYLFKKLNKLNFDDVYEVRWEDGTFAAYAYSAKGINSKEDYLKVYAEMCTETMLKNIDKGETFQNNGKYYFTYNYGRGGNYTSAVNLEKVSDSEYILEAYPPFPMEPGDPSRDYYKIIVEDGKYKLSERTSNYE